MTMRLAMTRVWTTSLPTLPMVYDTLYAPWVVWN